MVYTVKVTSVDYCVEEEDVEMNGIDIDGMLYEDIEKEIDKIKDSLPQELELEVECDREDLDDMVCDAITEETGWLINSFDYKILERKSSRSLI